MYKKHAIIFSDLDGTLLADNHQFSPETQQGVQELYEKGYFLIPITARSTKDLFVQAKLLKIDQLGGIIAGNNGSQIYDFGKQTWIQNLYLPSEVVTKIFNDNYNRYKAKVHFFGDNATYVFNEGTNSSYWAQVSNLDYIIAHDACEITAPITHLIIVLRKGISLDEVREFMDQLQKDYGHQVTIHQYDGRVVELLPLNVSKGAAVKTIMDYLSIDRQITKSYGFGDNYNDLPLFEAVDVGVAMENANTNLSNIADDKTEFNNNQSGVWRYVQTKILTK